MFNFGRGNSKDIGLIALIGLGLYAQCNELNLANNTTMLLVLFLLFTQHGEIQDIKDELCCIEEETGTCGCHCHNHNGGGIHVRRNGNHGRCPHRDLRHDFCPCGNQRNDRVCCV